jgi:hypothetical protein
MTYEEFRADIEARKQELADQAELEAEVQDQSLGTDPETTASDVTPASAEAEPSREDENRSIMPWLVIALGGIAVIGGLFIRTRP